jgi:hypothetical protein
MPDVMTNPVFCNTALHSPLQAGLEADTLQTQTQRVTNLHIYSVLYRLHINRVLAHHLQALVLLRRTERTQLARLFNPRCSTGGQAFSRCKKPLLTTKHDLFLPEFQTLYCSKKVVCTY